MPPSDRRARCDSRRADRQRVRHRVAQAVELRPGGGRLERLDEHAAVEQVVAQVRPGVAGLQPGAAPPAPRPVARAERAAGAAPPAGARRMPLPAAARAGTAGRGRAPSPAAPAPTSASPTAVSSSSLRRATSGASSSWASSRSNSAPSEKLGQEPALVAALPRDRPHPQRHLGDDAERPLGADQQLARQRARRRSSASRASTTATTGATRSSATTFSSMRPKPVDAWPAERVATQPPTVAHS